MERKKFKATYTYWTKEQAKAWVRSVKNKK
jgi:hypothetical protein